MLIFSDFYPLIKKLPVTKILPHKFYKERGDSEPHSKSNIQKKIEKLINNRLVSKNVKTNMCEINGKIIVFNEMNII